MVKFALIPLLAVVLLAMHTSVDAYGVVRVDIQKDSNTAAFANAINNAISSKIQSLTSFWSSLLQAKLAYGRTSPSVTASTSVNYVPIFQKTVRINKGYLAPVPTSTTVAEKTTTSDEDVVPGSSSGSAVAGGSTVVTVNKSLFPSVSVSTSPVGTSSATDAAASASSGTVTGYTYRKRFVSN